MKRVAFHSIMPLIREAFSRGKTITISVTGTSMTPTLDPRDAVTLEAVSGKMLRRGDIALYRRKNGQYVLHRVVKVTEDAVDFCGDAQVNIEKGVPHDAVLARVCSYEKNNKQYNTEEIRLKGQRRLMTRGSRKFCKRVIRQFIKSEKEPTLTPMRFMWPYIKKHTKNIVLMCMFSAFVALCTLGMAFVSGRVIDKAFYHDMNNFRDWFIMLFILLIVAVVSNFLYSHLRAKTTAKMRNELREELFRFLLNKQYCSVQNIHSGDIMNRLSSDIFLVTDSAINLIPQTVSLVIRLIGGISFMLIVDTVFTAFVVVGGVVIAGLLQFFSRVYKRLHKECQEIEGEARSYLQECIENLVVVKSFSNEEGVVEQLEDIQERSYRKQVRRNIYSGVGNMAVYSGFTLAYYTALAWGILRVAGRLGVSAMMSLGTFTTFLQIMEQIRAPFRSASGLVPQFYSMLASAERLQELTLLEEDEAAEDTKPANTLYDQLHSVSFQNVSFMYDADKFIFRNADISFQKNSLTVIVGPSGSGKTTLIKLLLGLLYPQEGRIVLETDQGDIPVNSSTRKLFTYVPQGNMILSGSLADNIRFGNESLSEERIEEACRLACLDTTVSKLPQGIHTSIGERGFGLSEGQVQRLAIARALASDAPIMLLDECTSSLDMETERQLIRNLKGLSDRTVLFISHRTAVLENADHIVTLEDLQNSGI